MNVICEICKKSFKSINNKHLSKHNITYKEYVYIYPNSKTVSDETSKKLSDNYITNKCKERAFQNGHKINQGLTPWNKGLTKNTDRRIFIISNKLKFRKLSILQKLHISRVAKLQFATGVRKKLIGKDNPMFGKKLSYAHKKALLESRNKIKQTKPEKEVESILKYFDNNWIYTGDRKFWVTFKNGRHKNPDFVNTKRKCVIEVFGRYWHKDKDEEFVIKRLYKNIGYECLIVWDDDSNIDKLIAYYFGYDWEGDDTNIKLEDF